VTRYEFFRKRIAPVLFLGMVGVIAYDSCRTHQRTHATVVLDFGEATADVRRVNAELVVGGDTLVTFERTALPGGTIGPCKFETALPEDSAQLHVDVTLGGKIKSVTRTIRLFEGSTVTIPLGDALR
jgi:hypothetical protein